MEYFDAWTLVAIIFTFNVAYFSYQSGRRSGLSEGIESTLEQLAAQGVIELEEDPEEL